MVAYQDGTAHAEEMAEEKEKIERERQEFEAEKAMIEEREKFEREKAEFAKRKAELEMAAPSGGIAPTAVATPGADVDIQNIQNIQQTTNITYVIQAAPGQVPGAAPMMAPATDAQPVPDVAPVAPAEAPEGEAQQE